MAHFAKIEDGTVTQVIVLRNEDCAGGDFPLSENSGKAFIASLGLDGEWVQTSYNRNFRGNFAGVGMKWNGVCFHDEAPFPSWVLDSNGTWSPPKNMPNDGKDYSWDEASVDWVEITPTP